MIQLVQVAQAERLCSNGVFTGNEYEGKDATTLIYTSLLAKNFTL